MELTIRLPHGDERLAMTGSGERNLKIIRESLGVHITARDGELRLSGEGDAVSAAAAVLDDLRAAARRGQPMRREQLLQSVAESSRRKGHEHAAHEHGRRLDPDAGLEVYLRGRKVLAKTAGQRDYLHAVANHDLTFCIGPAGTGKTYLAVAAAVTMLRQGACRKIVLVRPAVEAGEKLGFLPGGMQEKVNPYLRPLLDALHDMMEFDQIQRLMAVDVIEIIPLAFMRGRTLNDAVIILDEAQNTTKLQMLMFLTRLGHNAKMIVTGDASQIDLEDPRDSGLIDGVRRLKRVKGIAFVTLGNADIVRHDLVSRIVDAYAPKKAAAALAE